MLYLRNLNESFDKLYTLNEAYSDTFPKWFKNGLNSSATNYGISSLSAGDRYQGADTTYRNPKGGEAPKAGFKKDRGDYRSDSTREKESSLFNAARNAGIDLQNATFTEAPIEDAKKYTSKSKTGDPSKICVWGFPNGQVYVEGLNENERCLDDPKQLPFMWVSLKNMMQYATHFGYLEASELKPGMYKEKDLQRNRTHYDMTKMYDEHPEMLPNTKEGKHFMSPRTAMNRYGKKLDKSGYLRDPDRYKDALEKAHAPRVYQVLLDWHNKIESVYENYIATIDMMDPFDTSRDNFLPDISDIRLSVSTYNYYTKEVEHITDALEDGTLDKDEAYSRLKRLLDNLSTEYTYKMLDDMIKKTYSTVNWLR